MDFQVQDGLDQQLAWLLHLLIMAHITINQLANTHFLIQHMGKAENITGTTNLRLMLCFFFYLKSFR